MQQFMAMGDVENLVHAWNLSSYDLCARSRPPLMIFFRTVQRKLQITCQAEFVLLSITYRSGDTPYLSHNISIKHVLQQLPSSFLVAAIVPKVNHIP